MSDRQPWFERTLRWGQTNLTEIDPQRYDHDFWTRQWERTAVQGLIVNAGGIIAYYPSKLPLHFRSPYLGDRDLFGEIVERARERDLTVVARMDCNRADDRFYNEHPDWFCVDVDGVPYRAAGRFLACVNSPYYDDFIPDILTEIAERYSPDGFADNSWSGLSRGDICYCQNCARRFADATGERLPTAHDWESPAYRSWITWNYDRRIEIWDHFNAATTAAGGPDCRWIGMNSAQMAHQADRFRDLERIADRAPLVFIDHQFRSEPTGFQENAHTGKLVYGMKGWTGRAAESMAMYNYSTPPFRVGSKPEPEARMWAVEGIAGGIMPWWHHIGAAHQDRRQYDTAPPIFTWHRDAERYLIDRTPLANVGVVWSQRSFDFYGRDDAKMRAQDPYNGMINALIRSRIDYRPIHVNQLDGGLDGIDVLILPAVGALSQEACATIRSFVEAGGGLVATGESSLYDEWGESRPDFALSDLFGVRAKHRHHGAMRLPTVSWETSPTHTYLQIRQPWAGDDADRHPVLAGFADTDQLPFGGRVECVELTEAQSLLTFVAPFPAYPPETSWQRHPATEVPCAVVNERGGRVVYLPADIDRCFGRGLQPDHARLIGNAVRWAAHEALPLTVTGNGSLDLHLYRQDDDRLVLHLVNLSGSGAWRAPMHEYVPVGPFDVTIDLAAAGTAGRRLAENASVSDATEASLLVAGEPVEVKREGDRLSLRIPQIVHHEVVVVGRD